MPLFYAARQILKISSLLLLTAACLQCGSVPYYEQAIKGQMEILQKRQPISELIADLDTAPALRKKLLFIQDLRVFAEKELRLPVDQHYLSYVALDRPYVVWNVFAAPELSLTPKTWCFPVAGCVAYRGYFKEADARRFGDALARKGYDVFIGGAIAYSTLGWFDDPVLSTFADLSASDTAALIFHELAHGLLYIPDDTAFNEGFATAVEQEGLKRWHTSGNQPRGYQDWLDKHRRHQRFTLLVSKYRGKLQAVFESNIPRTQKQQQKAAVFDQMRSEFRVLKSKYRPLADYDAWFNLPLNNAQLISVSTYHNWVPAFRTMLAESGGNLEKFYQTCRQLAEKEPVERHHILTNLLQKAPAGAQLTGAVR